MKISSPSPRWSTTVEPQYAGFDHGASSGHYLRTRLRLEYHPSPSWIAGFDLPYVHLRANGKNETGLGNPVLFAERRFNSGSNWFFSSGLQLEIPGGGEEKGIGSDHLEILPFASVAKRLGSFSVFTHFGLMLALNGDDHGTPSSTPVLLVDPHEEKEWRLRIGTEIPHRQRRSFFRTFLEFQHPMDGPTAGENFIYAAGSLHFKIHPAWTLGPTFEIPLSSPKRMNWRLSMAIQFSPAAR